ncbi:MAG: hypothetical protein PHX93_00895 [Candidatus Peribacteraceae bacterium]|jgi:hypothetical protein|nr:hypothetical protein [Candidatus Peribacteraceae bacterium]
MTQKLFPDFGSEGLREARLIYDKTPERSGDAMRLDTEKRGPGFAEAKKALRDAATTLNDQRIKEMLADEETLNMIASQVELLAGNDSKKWLNAIALSFLQKSHDAFTGEGQAINAAKDKSTDLAKKCSEILQATIDELRKLQKAYSDAGGEGDFPGFDTELRGILEKKTNVDAFKKRFDQLVDLMKDILWATDDDLKDARKWTDKFKAIGIPALSLTPFTTATDATARRSALLKIVRETGGIELLNPEERKKVEAAMRAIDTKLSELQMNQQKLIADAFQERLRYLDRLGGTDQEALIHLSLERNGKFRLDALIQRLEILKKAKLTDDQKKKIEEALGLKTSVELTEAMQVDRILKKYKIKDANEAKKLILAILKGGRDAVEADRAKSEAELKKTVPSQTVSIEDFSRDLLSLWNTGKAEEYLRSEGVKIDNPTGVSLSALALRARLTDDVVKPLSDAQYDIAVGRLVEIAKMPKLGDGVKVGAEAAKTIIENSVKAVDATGKRLLVNEALLLEYFTFFSLEDKEAAARVKAKDQFNGLKTKGLIVDGGDGTLIVAEVEKPDPADPAKKIKVSAKDDLELELKNMTVSAKAKTICDAMGRSHVADITWKESVSMHASELWKLTKAGAGIWWDYIAGIRKNFWDPEHDADLLKLLNQQAALKDGKASLEKLLKTSSGAQRFLETTETGLHSRREAQLKALRGDPAVSPSEHNVQAEALLMANQHVIGQLNTMGWSTCSRRLRQLTLWTAMHKGTKKDPEAGLKEARQLLQAAGKLRTPEDQDKFVDEQMAKMKPAERQAFLRTIDARAIVETQAGRDILSPLKQRGLNLNPRALDLLRQAKDPANPALNLAAGIGRWTMDPPEKVRASLEIALEDSPAKAAFLEAFVTGEEQTYEYQGRTEKVSVIDARLAVNALQQRLLFEMRGSLKAKEQIEDEDEFTNPVDRWLRTGIESMKDLWNTDMVGKAEVIAIAFAAYWMIKEIWKNKKGKFVLLGLPILLGVNAIVKQRTGRDLLGENLRWKNKEDRTSPLEAFRRRGAALDKRYAVLMQPAGQAAIRVLMNEKNPIAVQELLAWRNAVKSGGATGSKRFSLGVPRSLRVSDIEDNLGVTGSREKACEVAYLAFESLCADVARINGLSGGNTDTNAEQGADLIQRRYVMNRSTSLKPATMFEVIMSECQMPTKEMLENRSYLEAAADLFGYTYDEAAALVKKYGVQAWVMMKQGIHKVPEIAAAAKDWAWDTGGAIHDWARLTYAKLKPEVVEDFAASWKFVVETGKAIGMTVITKGPGVVEFIFDGTVNITGRTLTELKGIHDYMMTIPLLHEYVGSFLESVSRVFGFPLKELDPEMGKKQYEEEEQAMVSFFDGGNYPIRDILAPNATVSAFEHTGIKRTDRLTFTKGVPTDPPRPISEVEVRETIAPLQAKIAKTLWGDATKWEDLKPSQKRYVMEILQANQFQALAKSDKLKDAIGQYEQAEQSKKSEIEAATTARDRTKQDMDRLAKDVADLNVLKKESEQLEKKRLDYQEEYKRLVVLATPTTDEQKRRDSLAIQLQQIKDRLESIDRQLQGLPTAEAGARAAQDAYRGAQNLLEQRQREYADLVRRGVDPVALDFTTLLTVATVDATILNVGNSANRRSDSLKSVTIANSKLFYIPMNWLMGDAEYRAFSSAIPSWVQRRLSQDPAYQEYVTQNKDPAARAAYERYLENVALNEAFLRSMLTSHGGAEGEMQHPLHLSVHEARLMKQYLEERERLVSFKQFLEVWSSVAAAERDQKLP